MSLNVCQKYLIKLGRRKEIGAGRVCFLKHKNGSERNGVKVCSLN